MDIVSKGEEERRMWKRMKLIKKVKKIYKAGIKLGENLGGLLGKGEGEGTQSMQGKVIDEEEEHKGGDHFIPETFADEKPEPEWNW